MYLSGLFAFTYLLYNIFRRKGTGEEYTEPLTIDTNKTIYARSIDSSNQGSDGTRIASLEVTNIDKDKPVINISTSKMGEFTLDATDSASGIVGYTYTTTTEPPTSFTSVDGQKQFNTTITGFSNPADIYYMWVKDAAQNIECKKFSVIGDYVKYNVTYQDVYSTYEFNENNGWRILSAKANESDATKDYRAAKTTNWLYLGSYEWTISRNSDLTRDVFRVTGTGTVNANFVTYSLGVFPSFNLESSVKYVSGSGSMSDPVRVN